VQQRRLDPVLAQRRSREVERVSLGDRAEVARTSSNAPRFEPRGASMRCPRKPSARISGPIAISKAPSVSARSARQRSSSPYSSGSSRTGFSQASRLARAIRLEFVNTL
jgi:hypothetical protein